MLVHGATEFFSPPADADAILNARSQLLEDMSLASHILAAENVRSGQAFRTAAPDPGFDVLSFELSTRRYRGRLTGGSADGHVDPRGTRPYLAAWVAQPEGVIRSVDTALAALPIDIILERLSVRIVKRDGYASVRLARRGRWL